MDFFILVLLSLPFVCTLVQTQESRDFRRFLHRPTNPCDDFYQYACGRWTPINSQAKDVLTDQKLKNLNTLKEHFSTLQRRQLRQDTSSQFYHQCLQSKFQLNADILQPYLSTLVEISEWPLLNITFNSSAFDWLSVSAKLRRFQVDTLFQLNIQRSWKNSDNYIVYLSRSKADSPWDEESSFMYKTYVKYILLDLGVRIRRAKALAQEVVDFESDLDKLSTDIENTLSEPITLRELTTELPDMDWMTYFSFLFGKPPMPSQQIVVETNFFRKLKTLIDRTKKEIIALAQMTRFLRHFGVRMDQPDWKSCMDEVNLRLPLQVAKKFLSLREDSFSPSKIRRIFDAIREELRLAINGTSWYDTTSREELLNKLTSVRLRIGYLESDFRSLPDIQIDPQNYQRSRMLLAQHAVSNELNLLTGNLAADVGRKIEPLNVNAYYRLTTNSLDIPVGILQPPIYREDASWAQIMGTLGAIFGHELVHGFDYDGQSYDANGVVRSQISPRHLIQFGVRAKCYIDQYDNKTDAAVNEDIADNEGLHLAYSAFQRLSNEQPRTNQEFAEVQLFFISFAQIWCRSEYASRAFRLHSSNKDRVNNVVANSEKFAEAFSCRSTAQMNPIKKCRIW